MQGHSPPASRAYTSTRGSFCDTSTYAASDSTWRYAVALVPRSWRSVPGDSTSNTTVGLSTTSRARSMNRGSPQSTITSGYA